jgi:hypothetical protein
LIDKNSFILGTTNEDSAFYKKICTSCPCDIQYTRNNLTYKDFFVLNKDTFNINELLVVERLEFYVVNYKNKRYLLVSSPDFSASGKAYSTYKNYYLFTYCTNRTQKMLKINSDIDSKLDKNKFFLSSVKN